MERNDISNAESKNDKSTEQSCHLHLSQLTALEEENPNDVLHFVVDNASKFLTLLNAKDLDPDLMSVALNVLGRTCNAENCMRKLLNKLIITFSLEIETITINIQRHLMLFEKLGELKKCHRRALYNLTEFLKKLQLTLPFSSLYTVPILLPILTCTCDKYLKIEKELHAACLENLKVLEDKQKCFCEHYSLNDEKNRSETEKLHFEEPPESFRTLSVLPTANDVRFPCSFLRPNITKGSYKDAEHYLDVHFRLLREDYIKPLRDGIAEYLISKKNNKYMKKCENICVYERVYIISEEFVDGDLLHVIQFQEYSFSAVNWECSTRFIRGNLLCFTVDCFRTMMFATVVLRKTDEIKKGLLLVKFENENDNLSNLDFSLSYVVIEVSTLFEAYCHNLKVLQQLTEETLPMKNYIIHVEKMVKKPQYVQSTTVYNFGPLLIPLEDYRKVFHSQKFKFFRVKKKYSNVNFDKHKNVTVIDDGEWPSASELHLDESQYAALKSAITKEFSIIQGPPGTGKTYIGLRTVQLLLHNIDRWFNDEPNTLPILIVCYTNHALDQFLEGISKLTRKIVRIGGRGANEAVDAFQIRNLVRKAIRNEEIPGNIKDDIFDTKQKIQCLKKDIVGFEDIEKDSTDHVFHEHFLKEYIPPFQFNSLKKINNKKQSDQRQIFAWLEVNTCETFQDNDDFNYQIPLTSTIDELNEMDVDDEGDIEFFENQRNVDYYDFDDILVLKRISSSNIGVRKHNQKQLEYVKNNLKNNLTLSEHRALKIKNVWCLPITERWQLYKFWLEKCLSVKRQEYLELQQQLKDLLERLSRLRTKQDLFVIQDAVVVGMTTTGAAKYRHLMEERNPVILIVEEAAEILESHIITSLAPKTQHVILIGDQQQLRPSPTVHMLAVKYGLDVSLFERMIDNGIEYQQLSLQHRMRPEISTLIVPHIYPNLKNHPSVSSFENIKGVNKNVYFINHHFKELHFEDSKSKVNEHEARFVVRLCSYLICQGYKPSNITVLTAYTGQLFILKKMVKNEAVKQVRFTVVDSFQGDENDIVLVSFVRSNDKGEVGFLKVSNRICVALSRAKKGLYCIGNFELLAQKSNLWHDIVQTLEENKSIGPSLRLCCQNHPEIFNDVAKDSDFDSVPEGGCKRKCEFHLSCGHPCPLFCHPYDPEHKSLYCEKPCPKTCAQGHLCQKKCREDCGSCPVLVNKTLSRCGHLVNTFCGKSEYEIECQETCRTVCNDGHPCPKKCFEYCGPCKVIVDRVLTKCGHMMKVLCFEQLIDILCYNQCRKSCDSGHPCQKLCHELCGPCQVPVDKQLNSCGHVVKASCYKAEIQIKCKMQCKKTLSCSHQCMKKCYEACETECKQITKIQSPSCGHTLKIECFLKNDLDILSQRCSEPCKEVMFCGHSCKGTCSKCKQKTAHVSCEEMCERLLLCGHKCTNKCSDPCIQKCVKLVQIESSVCGHQVETKCRYVENLNKLSKKCTECCKAGLPCGHTCKGTCGRCYQGRLHIKCKERCGRILICGHKCQSKCFKSCPPCRRPCENRCMHQRCPKKCGDPCLKCTKPCGLSCIHKQCLRRCDEICDRDPCTMQCEKKLACGHQCIGFCGEPCPTFCLMCDEILSEVDVLAKNDRGTEKDCVFSGYVLLEDCQHTVKEVELSEWACAGSVEIQGIKMKSCPKCGVIIRKNARYSKIIKNVLSDVERIKQITKFDEKKNLEIQRSLFELVISSHPNISVLYKHIVKVVSGENVRSIQELTTIENIINLANETELKNYGIHSMFVLKPFHKKLVHHARYCRQMIKQFILLNFLTISEYQFFQLSREFYRLNLLDRLLMFAKQKHFTSASPFFERLASSLMTCKPLTDEDISNFRSQAENFAASFQDFPLDKFSTFKVVNMTGDDWYQCPKAHLTCIKKFKDNIPLVCYVCNETKRISNKHRSTIAEDVEYSLVDDPSSGSQGATESPAVKRSINVSVKALHSAKQMAKSAAETLPSDICANNTKFVPPFLRNSYTRTQYGKVMKAKRTGKKKKRAKHSHKKLSSVVKAKIQGKYVPHFHRNSNSPRETNEYMDIKIGKKLHRLKLKRKLTHKSKSTNINLPVDAEPKSHNERSTYKNLRIDTKAKYYDKLAPQPNLSPVSLWLPSYVFVPTRTGEKATVNVNSAINYSSLDVESKSRDKRSSKVLRSSDSFRRSEELSNNPRTGRAVRNETEKVKIADWNLDFDTEAKSHNKLSSQLNSIKSYKRSHDDKRQRFNSNGSNRKMA